MPGPTIESALLVAARQLADEALERSRHVLPRRTRRVGARRPERAGRVR